MESVKRLFDILPFHQSHYLPKEDVLAGKEEGKWKKYSIDKYIEIVNDLSSGLLKLGVEKVIILQPLRPTDRSGIL